MAITVRCENCGAESAVPEEFVGKKGRCRKCGESMTLGVAPTIQPEPPKPTVAEKLADAKSFALNLAAKLIPKKEQLPALRPEVLPAETIHSPPAVPPPLVVHVHAPPAPLSPAPAPSLMSCPFCAEMIQPAAKKCRHCGEFLDPVLRKSNEKASVHPQPQIIHAPAPPIVINNQATASAKAGSDRGRRRWSPLVAFLLSLICPGLGQLYKGHPFNGLLWFILVVVGYAALIVPGAILHVLCVLGAASGDPYR